MQLVEEGAAKVCGRDAEGRVHEAEARFEMEREEAAEGVGFREIGGGPVVAKRSVASTRDATDVAETQRIDKCGGRKCPGTSFRPSRDAKFVVAQRVGDSDEVVCPAGVRARLLRAGLPHAGPVDTEEAEPMFHCGAGE